MNCKHSVSQSKVGILWIWLKSVPPPNDTPMFWEFLNGNSSKSPEIWKASNRHIIKNYRIIFVPQKSVLKFKNHFKCFGVSFAGLMTVAND